MALTCGFFNSLNGDKQYNAEQISKYFKGLVSENGIFANVGGAFQVVATTGLTLNVLSGRALINSFWVDSTAAESINLNAAHVTLNRYSAIVLECSTTTRDIIIKVIDGENATNPVKPSITQTAEVRDLLLAYVYVPAGTDTITQAQITDTRADTTKCGWITGLINQVDTSTLFSQWQSAYEQFYAQMVSWFETERADFDTWFAALTEELNINTYVVEYNKMVTLSSSSSRDIALNMTGYTYDSTDVFLVFFNGLKAEETTDYTINSATPKITVVSSTFTGDVEIKIMKSQIGWSQG